MKKKELLLIGFITYIFMLILAYLYYLERIVMPDTSFQLFQMIQHNGFAIQIQRFGAALTQIVPILFIKNDSSLHTVTLAYSLSFIIYYFASFLFVLLYLKNKNLALIILLYNTLMVRHSFFWVQCEFVQGVVFTLTYFAYLDNELQKKSISKLFYVISSFCLITIVFFYPSLLFLITFGFIYFLFRNYTRYNTIGFLFLFYILTFVFKQIFLPNNYDAGAMSGLHNIMNKFPHYFTNQSTRNFFHYLKNDYYLVLIPLVASLSFYFIQKSWLKFAFLIAFFFGYLFIINMNYYDGAEQFYLESQYLLLTCFASFPFVYEVLPTIKFPKLKLGFIVLLIGISLIRIEYNHKTYSNRISYLNNLINETNSSINKKRIVPTSKLDMNILRMHWGLPYETWLLSTLKNNATSSIVSKESDNQYQNELNKNKSWITVWETIDYNKLNPTYFKFTDTTFYKEY